MTDERPYEDLAPEGASGAFTLPLRKWREIVFIGAMREDVDGLFVRDPERPLPPMREPGLFPEGRRFRLEHLPEARPRTPDPVNPARRERGRVRLTPVSGGGHPAGG